MANNNTTTGTADSIESDFVIYYPLILVVVGTTLNLLTLIVLCRPLFQDVKKHSTMHYLRAMAIFDILMLYGWNLDHYLASSHGFTLLNYSIPTCKILTFVNYFASQTSAWLRVFVAFDRYLLLSRPNRVWLCKSKGILIIIGCIILFLTLLNLPLPIVACYYKPNGKISYQSQMISLYPLWDYINLGVYNCAPFFLMSIFNSAVIYHLAHHYRTTRINNTQVQHRSISITLVLTTFLFSFMTIPVTVAYAFFYDVTSSTVLHALDCLLYTYHILSFPLYMITFGNFRREYLAMVTYTNNNKNRRTVATNAPRVFATNRIAPKSNLNFQNTLN